MTSDSVAADVAEPDLAGVQWRHLHKVTPALNAWKTVAVIFALVTYNSADELAALPLPVGTKILIVVGAVIVAAILGLIWGVIAWRKATYAIGDESIYMHSGVIWRQQRHMRLDRLQTVEVTQPLMARIFGFAALTIESAGSLDSKIQLAYLTEPEALRVRSEILARAAGVRLDRAAEQAASAAAGPAPTIASTDATTPADSSVAVGTDSALPGAVHRSEQAPAPEAPETPLMELSAGRLIGSLVRSIGLWLALVATIGWVIPMVILTKSATGILGAMPLVLAFGGYAWSRFAGEFAFKVAYSADGVRLRHGLTETKARTVPPGRVQAIGITQPVLWRRKGWWRVQVNIAGYGMAEANTSGVLYPVATTDELKQLLPLVLPDLGTDRPLEFLNAALTGQGSDEGFLTSPERAKLFDPFSWRRNGVGVTDTAVVTRGGRLYRWIAIVPHVRTQSIRITSGPLERRRGLAGIDLHTTPGNVRPVAVHLDQDEAMTFILQQAVRARTARKHSGPEKWMQTAASQAPDAAPEQLRASYGGVLPGRSL